MSRQLAEDKARDSNSEKPGITAIEIGIGLTILFILASLAVPRVAAVNFETPSAATVALGSELRTVAARAHALWLAEGQPATVRIDGRPVRLAHGYPSLDSIPDALATTDGYVYDKATGVFSRLLADSTPNPDCSVSYRAPRAKGEAPQIATVTDAC